MNRTLIAALALVFSLCATAQAQTYDYLMEIAESGKPWAGIPGRITYTDPLGSAEGAFGPLRFSSTFSRQQNNTLRYSQVANGRRITLQVNHPQYYHTVLQKWRKDMIVDSAGTKGFSRIFYDGSDDKGRRYVEILEIEGEPLSKCSLRIDAQNRLLTAFCEAEGLKYRVRRR